MQKYTVFFIMIILAFSSGAALAQNNNDNQGEDSGIEARTVSQGVTVLMPKGGRMYKTNELTSVQESTDEYAARNFASVENRLNKLEKENREFREEIRNIESKLNMDNNAPAINKE